MMNGAHLHLMFNHLSIVGLGFVFLVNLLVMFEKHPTLKKLPCWLYIILALMALMAILTGDSASEIISTYPGVDISVIEYHETWGYAFFYGLVVLGVISLAGLWFSRKSSANLFKFSIATLIVALGVAFFAFKTGGTGGSIRHPEIEQGVYKKKNKVVIFFNEIS